MMSDGKGRLETNAGRHCLRFERLLAHPREKVWRALTENVELSTWFPARIEGSREAGASLRFVMPPKPGQLPADTDEEGPIMTGSMLVYDPPRLLEYLWDVDVLRWELEPHTDGTLLTFTHAFDDQGRGARDAAGWEFCFGSLEARLAGRPGKPFTSEGHAGLFTQYEQRFGPAGSSQKTPDF
jgi:uncharacterized protein YndB with AHSA1/START domain